jgi:hypothetical protein
MLTKRYDFFYANRNIFFSILSATLNMSLPVFVSILMALSGNLVLSAEIAISTTVISSVCQIFSANVRSIVISNNSLRLVYSSLYFRLILSFSIIVFSIFFLFFIFELENNVSIFLIGLIICTQWIMELALVNLEINKRFGIKYIFTFVYLLFLFFFILIILLDKIFYINYLLVFCSIFNILFISIVFQNFLKKIIFIKYFFYFIKKSILSINFLSSFSLIASNLIWRLLLFFIFEKNISAIAFSSYAIGSFFGTIFSGAISPTLIKNKINLKNAFIFFIFFILTIILYLYYKIYYVDQTNLQTFQSLTLIFSLSGVFFMLPALYSRQLQIQKLQSRSKSVFLLDVYYSIFLLIVMIVLIILGSQYIIFGYFASSILSFVFYKIFLSKKLSLNAL